MNYLGFFNEQTICGIEILPTLKALGIICSKMSLTTVLDSLLKRDFKR